MEQHIFKDDVGLMLIAAQSFPKDIFNAHEELLSWVTYKKEREFFGLSFPDKYGKIQYMAAATEYFEGEGMLLGLETFRLKKGNYHYITIPLYKNEISENIFKI